MKIYSNTLTGADLSAAIKAVNLNPAYRAVRTELDPFNGVVGFEKYQELSRPRIRARGWNVLLYRVGSTMHFNTGQYGAGEEGAASYDDWGWFLAELFRRDPVMRAAYYDGEAQFHRSTHNAFRPESEGGSPRMLSASAKARLGELGLNQAEATQVLAEARRTNRWGTPVDGSDGQTYVVTYGPNQRYQITREPDAADQFGAELRRGMTEGHPAIRQVPVPGPQPDPLVFG